MNLVSATLKLPSKHCVHGNFCHSANNILFPFFRSNPKEIIVKGIFSSIDYWETLENIFEIYRKLSCKLYAFELMSSFSNVTKRSNVCEWSQQVIDSLFKECFTELQKYPRLPESGQKYMWSTHSAFKLQNMIKLQQSNIDHHYCEAVTRDGVNNIQLIYTAHLNQWDNSTHPADFC